MYLSKAIQLRLKYLMDVKKINGNKLALASGIDRSTINKFLREQTSSIKIETITLICQALDITLKDFFDDKLFNDVEVND